MYLIKSQLLGLGLVLLLVTCVNSQDASNGDTGFEDGLDIDALDKVLSSSGSGAASTGGSLDTKAASDAVSNSFDSNSINEISSSFTPTTTNSPPRFGIPRLGSGYIMEQVRNFNLGQRVQRLMERIRRLNAQAREFRSGIRVNPDSLAYRTGRRISLTFQGLATRASQWSRARQQGAAASGGNGASSGLSAAIAPANPAADLLV